MVAFLLWFLGSACLGLIVVVFTSTSTQVNCLRQSSGLYDCQLRTLFLGKVPIFQRTVQNVTGMTVQENDDQDGTTYEAYFSTANGHSVALTGDSDSNYDYISGQADAISSQISHGADRFSYTANFQWWVFFLTVGLTFMSMLLSLLWLGRGRRR
ncbi:MAG TPA: hypothetical protein VLX61_00315 [Anaerolineales bacterium]|nr:hypothetical protein [Anaerolineales bacterium]